TLMQTDRRLVEDVDHAHQTGADLCREADPLRLAARERRRTALECEVVEPDIDEKAQTGPDLLQDHPGDRTLTLGQRLRQRVDPGDGVTHGHPRDLDDV